MLRPRRSPEEQQRLDQALRDLFEHRITFNQVLGLSAVSVDATSGVTLAFDMRDELVGHYLYGQLHGGVTSAVLDAAGGLAAMAAVGEKHCDETADQVMARFAKVGTIDLRVDYLRKGIGKRFVATTRVTRLGGRICSVQMELANEAGELIATGAGAYMVG